MMKNFFKISSIFSLLLFIGIIPLYSSSQNAGSTSGDFLNFGVGSRAPAMADVYTAEAKGPEGLFYNPAGLTSNYRSEAGFMYYTLFEGMSFNYLGFVRPLKDKNSAYGLGLIYMDYGSFDKVALDPGTGDLYNAGTFDAYDLAVSGGYAYDMSEKVTLGISGKFIQSSIDDVSANAFAMDFGAKFKSVLRGLDLGFAIQNVGTKMRYIQDRENLPVTVKLGLFSHLVEDRLNIGLEGFKRSGEDFQIGVGAEFYPFYQFCLRVGYTTEDEASDGLRAGFGVNLDNFRFDYAYIPNDKFTDGHRFTGTVMFGAPETKTRPKNIFTAKQAKIEENETESNNTTDENIDYNKEISEAQKERANLKVEDERQKALDEALNEVLEAAEKDASIEKQKIEEQTSEEQTQVYKEESNNLEEITTAAEPVSDMDKAMKLFNDKRYEESIAILKTLAEQPDADFMVYYNLATAYYSTYRFALASKYYKKSLEANPEDSDAHLYLGYSYYQLGSIERAISEWKTSYDLNPSNTSAADALRTFGAM